jgi:hypothetical protein
MKKLNIILSGLTCAMLIGCGGGGSSSGGSNNSNLTTSDSNLFPSTAKIAEPTKENVNEVSTYIVSNNSNSNQGLLLSTDSNKINIESLLVKITPKFNNLPINEVVNEKDECSDGGYMEVEGNADETGGVVTVTYNNCKEDNLLINGSMYVSAKSYNEQCDEPTHYQYKILNDLSITYGATQMTLAKDSSFTANVIFDDNCNVSQLHYSNVNELTSINGKESGVRHGDYVIDFNYPYTITYNAGDIYI